ncbi:hypothetical protein [Pseudonocardia acaciae]|uniref:hypothetical protein n=1 Tax=Pseudonocardia acaciae TaxID=551276 RepID=UPI0006885BF1|nr:hypothetical protein [Pseudonocardia acaciae]
MLLLVLIFVLAAFGLLLVALVTGTAAWAWISVAVSVAAAGALVYDWAQRRAAIRSGGGGDRTLSGVGQMSAGAQEPPTAAIPVMGGAMMDPRTEVFQPVRQGPPARPPVADAPETVAFRPASPPPGSPERPLGAQPDGGTPGEQWSPRVTPGGRDRSDAPDSPGVAPSGDREGVNAAERTTRFGDGKSGTGRDTEGDPKQRRTPPGRDQAEQWKPRQPANAERPPADEDERAKAGAPKPPKRPAPDADSARTTAIPVSDRKAEAERKRAEQEQADREQAEREKAERAKAEREKAQREKAERERAEQQKAEREKAERDKRERAERERAEREKAEREEAARREAEEAEDAEPAQEPEPVAEAEEEAAPEQAAPPPRSAPPDPDEEQPDSSAEAIVAELDDEVLVIDEHPRYHLAGCRVLSGNETIPLPAKEAVEYGFTPCGTCSPVSTLAERNRAASSS